MADEGAYLQERIGDGISAESYQHVASIGGWGGGGRTLWAIAAIGAIAGAAIGAVAPFFPLLALGFSSGAVSAAAAAVPTSIAVFAATGMASGFSGGLILGRISGVSSAVAQEQEKRLKDWMARQMKQQNPGMELAPEPEKKEAPKKPFWQRVKDNYHTYFNPRVGLAFTLLGAVGGLVLGAAFVLTGTAPLISPLESLTGLGEAAFASKEAIAANAAPILAYTTGVMGAFGALWNINLSRITSDVTHFFGELMSGRMLGREWGPKPEQAVEQATEKSMPAKPAMETHHLGKPHLTVRQFASYTEMVAHKADPSDLLRR